MMKEVATIVFQDCSSSEEAVAIVRYDVSLVALCLSLRSGDEVEVEMRKSDVEKLIEGLKKAVNQA